MENLRLKVKHIEDSMPQQSDFRVLAEKFTHLNSNVDSLRDSLGASLGKWDRVADNLSALTTQLARKEETEKHLIKESEQNKKDIQTLSVKMSTVESYIAADKPWAEMKVFIIRALVLAAILAIAGVFFANPFK